MWVLFEAGLIASHILFKDRQLDEGRADEASSSEETTQGTNDYEPLSDEEMNAEMDAAERDESNLENPSG